MASGFLGFMQGFSATGAEIVKERDKTQQALEMFAAERQIQSDIEAKAKKRERDAMTQNNEAARQSVLGGGSSQDTQNAAPAPINPQAGYDASTEAEIPLGASPTSAPAASTMAPASAQPAAPVSLSTPASVSPNSHPAQAQYDALDPKAREALVSQYVDENNPDRQLAWSSAKGKALDSLLKQKQEMDAAARAETKARNEDPLIKAKNDAVIPDIQNAQNTRSNFQDMMDNFDRLEIANNSRINPYGIGPNITGAASTLAQEGTKGALKFTAQTKGSISDYEGKLFRGASINEDNRKSVNQNLINIGRAVAIRQAQMADFIDAFESRHPGSTPAEAVAAFAKFANDNRIIDKDKHGNVALTKDVKEIFQDDSYMNYLDGPPAKSLKKPDGTPAASPAKNKAVESVKGEFSSFFK